MAEVKKTQKAQKKEFFEVGAPITATKIHLYAASREELEGRHVKLDLTRNLRGKNLELDLIVHLRGQELIAEPVCLELIGSYVRKMMRKGADYVEDSFEAECKNVNVLVKPFLITRNKVSRAIRKELRNNAKKYLEGYFKNRSSSEIFSEITTNKIQKELSLKLKKTYPLALCEIRVFRILGEKKAREAEKK